jgi:excisionase family DNA binding protein
VLTGSFIVSTTRSLSCRAPMKENGVVRTDERQMLTTTDAARALGVGASSIKRWTDAGELRSMRTPGGHRRYSVDELQRFADARGLARDALPQVAPISPSEKPKVTLEQALRCGDAGAASLLLSAAAASDPGSSAQFLDEIVAPAMRSIGDAWEAGSCGVDEEHRASHLLADILDGLRSYPQSDGPTALLACPPGEWHDLPLRMLRLIVERSGWRSDFTGAHLPWAAIRNAVMSRAPRLVLLTARSRDAFVSPDFLELAHQCSRIGITLAVGGAWARGGGRRQGPYLRFRSLRSFVRWLRHDARLVAASPPVTHRA